MRTLYHFGDSYSTCALNVKHYVEILSDKLKYDYLHYGVGGSSNENIFIQFLKHIYNFKDGDILFFNFSFFVRGTYYDKDKKEILSSNFFVNDSLRNYRKIDLEGLEYVMGVFDYHVNHMEDYNRKVFNRFDTIFDLLVKRNISIYYIFNENCEFSDDLLKNGFNIKFPDGYTNWLHQMDYHGEQECHYTKGVQPEIYQHIIQNYPEILNKTLI
jgi:hypothetical protein